MPAAKSNVMKIYTEIIDMRQRASVLLKIPAVGVDSSPAPKAITPTKYENATRITIDINDRSSATPSLMVSRRLLGTGAIKR